MAQSGPNPGYSNYNLAAAPAAGGVVAGLAVVPGTYEVTAEIYYSGTVAAAEQDNMELQSDPAQPGAMVSQGVMLIFPAVASTSLQVGQPRRYVVAALSVIQVIAIGAATASSGYHASLRALQLPDGATSSSI